MTRNPPSFLRQDHTRGRDVFVDMRYLSLSLALFAHVYLFVTMTLFVRVFEIEEAGWCLLSLQGRRTLMTRSPSSVSRKERPESLETPFLRLHGISYIIELYAVCINYSSRLPCARRPAHMQGVRQPGKPVSFESQEMAGNEACCFFNNLTAVFLTERA